LPEQLSAAALTSEEFGNADNADNALNGSIGIVLVLKSGRLESWSIGVM
jgi:hypothetical protein